MKFIYESLSQEVQNRSGMMVEVNDIITVCTGSHNAAYLLGSVEQSKGCLYYLSDYITKDKALLGDCLSVLHAAKKFIDKHPSVAEDTGTTRRTAMHWMTRTLNMLAGQMEVSDTQCALSLLGLGCEVSSDSFAYFSCWEAMSEVKEHFVKKEENTDTSETSDSYSDSDFSSDDSSISDSSSCNSDKKSFPNKNVPKKESGEIKTVSGKWGFAKLYLVDQGQCKIPVSNETHYRYRGKRLQSFNHQEYACLIKIQIMKDDEDKKTTSKVGKDASEKILFEKDHPLFASHYQTIAAKQSTCIFTGKYIPKYPGPRPESNTGSEYKKWFKKADLFAKFYLISFKPNSGYDVEEWGCLNWDSL